MSSQVQISTTTQNHFTRVKDTPHSDKYLLGLINNDSVVIEQIYTNYFPVICNYVIKNNGTNEEALDVFQDGMLVILKKAKTKGFQLTSSFSTYLYAVCRLTWLKQHKRKNRRFDDLVIPNSCELDFAKDIDEISKEKLFKSKMDLLSPESRKVLEMFFNKTSMQDISEIMGYTMEYAKRKKYKAKNKLVQLIKEDKAFKYFYA